MSKKYQARRRLAQAVLTWAASELYADDHPGDPTGDWDCEYREDNIDQAVNEYIDARNHNT